MLGSQIAKLISKNSNLCDHNPPTSQSDGQTDRRHAIAITALCTKVHRAVKMSPWKEEQVFYFYSLGVTAEAISDTILRIADSTRMIHKDHNHTTLTAHVTSASWLSVSQWNFHYFSVYRALYCSDATLVRCRSAQWHLSFSTLA